MSRSNPEWIGKHDDQAIPALVRDRVLDRRGRKCAYPNCTETRKLQLDHEIALALCGEHRERNLQPLCPEHHRDKTKLDVKLKAKGARIRLREAGLHRRKGRPMPGTKASGLKKRMDGTVERRPA